MDETRAHRRLAAIAIADVVGYWRLIQMDEAGTLARLKERRRSILQPIVSVHGGRIAKIMPNLLADKEVIPEFIQYRAKPNAIVEALQPLIENANARERMISEFDAMVPRLGDIGASERAARAIIEEIEGAN